jgi:hypothetical protein
MLRAYVLACIGIHASIVIVFSTCWRHDGHENIRYDIVSPEPALQ